MTVIPRWKGRTTGGLALALLSGAWLSCGHEHRKEDFQNDFATCYVHIERKTAAAKVEACDELFEIQHTDPQSCNEVHQPHVAEGIPASAVHAHCAG